MVFPPYTPDHTDSGGSAIQFTSQGEIQRIFSYKGEKLHLDDLDSSDPNYLPGTDPDATSSNFITEVIQRVTSEIMEYLAPRYNADDLKSIPRIRQIATYFACYYLSRRRGNEAVYEAERIEYLDILERYQLGELYLDAPSSGPRAVLQSYVTDNRYYRNPTRVLQHASTDTVAGQHLMYQYPFTWL
jgi:hypothetical protein